MSSCNNKNCKNCICNKNKTESDLSWGDNLHKVVEAYADAIHSQRAVEEKFFNKLAKNYELIIVDNTPGTDYQVSYRTDINMIDMASILSNYFGIEVEITQKPFDDDILEFEDFDGDEDD